MYHNEESPASRALPLEEALRYATSLAEMLRQMHRDGMVCGHLDPKNLVWDSHRVRMALTEAGSTEAYLAPEQVSGEAADVRCDVFAFGAVFYELLTGRRAFPAQDPEAPGAHRRHSRGHRFPAPRVPGKGPQSALPTHELHSHRTETGQCIGAPGAVGGRMARQGSFAARAGGGA